MSVISIREQQPFYILAIFFVSCKHVTIAFFYENAFNILSYNVMKNKASIHSKVPTIH